MLAAQCVCLSWFSSAPEGRDRLTCCFTFCAKVGTLELESTVLCLAKPTTAGAHLAEFFGAEATDTAGAQRHREALEMTAMAAMSSVVFSNGEIEISFSSSL